MDDLARLSFKKETLLDHFKGLNQEQESDFPDISEEQVSHYNEELNRESELEIRQAIKGLKNNKACADYAIRNEFIRASDKI